MGSRLPNPRLAKIHLPYSVEEVARLYGKHRNTVRHWIKQGLPIYGGKRSTLILGCDLREFLQAKRTKNKRPCKPGEIYCVRCRTQKFPWGGVADYKPMSAFSGMLIGRCPDCETKMYRRVSLAKLDQVRGHLVVTITQAHSRIDESKQLSVNSDYAIGVST